jgi:DNA repair protein RadC
MGRSLIKEIPIGERPRERLLKYGAGSLSNAELLAIVLKTGVRGSSVYDLANDVLKKVVDVSNLGSVSVQELMSINGIGCAKAIELLASVELGKRVFFSSSKLLEKFSNSSDVYSKNKYLFYGKKQEYFYCLYLDSKKELIERKLLFMGTINKSIVHPREIFKEAYRLSASSIICMHNHPSGDRMPSMDDVILTNALVEIGRLQQIPIVDHMIFTDDSYYSFYENGVLGNEKII